MLPYKYDIENYDTGGVLPLLLCLCGDTWSLRPPSFYGLERHGIGAVMDVTCVVCRGPLTASFLTWCTKARCMDRATPLLPSLPNSSVSPVFIKRLVSDN